LPSWAVDHQCGLVEPHELVVQTPDVALGVVGIVEQGQRG